MSSQSLRPKDGFRLLLEFAEESATGARYDATIYLPTAEHVYDARITLPAGDVELQPRATPAAAGPHAQLVAQLRTVARGKVKDLDQPWPRRILRWRPDRAP